MQLENAAVATSSTWQRLLKVKLLLLASCIPIASFSQSKTDSASTQMVKLIRKQDRIHWVIPTVLVTSGVLLMLDTDADEFFVSNLEVREERNENFINFSHHLDDYLQHVPAASVFILSVGGVKGRHNLPNQVALYIKSELLMFGVVYPLKYTVGESRPDTGQKNSFPSGHTAQAFTAATFLSKEYGHKSIWISIGAYSAATTVGVFRMLNNRHWISDVLVGAGIGIFSTEIVYATHKDRWGRKVTSSKLTATPFSAFGSNGISLTYHL
jgi:membrane-associated phospholipid phosphatase